MRGTMSGPKQMHKPVPTYSGTYNQTSRLWEINIDSASNQLGMGWKNGGENSIFYETYIDLDGYFMEALTFFPLEARVQDPGLFSANLATAANMYVMDIMSTERLRSTTIQKMLNTAD